MKKKNSSRGREIGSRDKTRGESRDNHKSKGRSKEKGMK